VDVGDDATAGNGGLDQRIELLVSTDGQLEEIAKNTFIDDKVKIMRLRILFSVTDPDPE
jgi:hypothetical protein